jgi:hypothetical protein
MQHSIVAAILVAVGLFFGGLTARADSVETVGQFMSTCNANHGFCIRYVQGMIDGLMAAHTFHYADDVICFQNSASYGEIGEQYIGYLRSASPQENNAEGLREFLISRYGCHTHT